MWPCSLLHTFYAGEPILVSRRKGLGQGDSSAVTNDFFAGEINPILGSNWMRTEQRIVVLDVAQAFRRADGGSPTGNSAIPFPFNRNSFDLACIPLRAYTRTCSYYARSNLSCSQVVLTHRRPLVNRLTCRCISSGANSCRA